MATPAAVTVYSRANCHLCDEAKAAIRAAQSLFRLDLDVAVVDIDSDETLRLRYTNDVPVVLVDGKEAFRHRVDPHRLAELVRGGVRSHSSLAAESCVPCRGGVPPLEGEELATLTRELGNGWVVVNGHHLSKEFTFPDFAQALAFTNAISAIAEREGHHPDLHLGWGRLAVEIWTHAIDGLTRSDFVLAAKIDDALIPPLTRH